MGFIPAPRLKHHKFSLGNFFLNVGDRRETEAQFSLCPGSTWRETGAGGDTSPWLFLTWHLLTALPPHWAQQRGKGRRWGRPSCSSQTTETKILLIISYRNLYQYFLLPQQGAEEKRPVPTPRFCEGQSRSVPEPEPSSLCCCLR